MNIFIYWVIIAINTLILVGGVFLIILCEDEQDINRKKLWGLIFIFGPACWLGALLAKCAIWISNLGEITWLRK